VIASFNGYRNATVPANNNLSNEQVAIECIVYAPLTAISTQKI